MSSAPPGRPPFLRCSPELIATSPMTNVGRPSGRDVLEETWGVVREWLGELPAKSYDVPSVLDGWTVGDLIAHVGRGLEALVGAVPAEAGVGPLTIRSYVATYPEVASEIAEASRLLAVETAADPLGALDASWNRASKSLDQLAADSADRVVVARRGPILVSDLVVTRVLELVVHADDLHRSLRQAPAVVLPRAAVRLVVRTLLDALVELAPGHSVEVRVPPFAAVQCLGGPRHTRGTPPNVIEAEPLTWIRLACGRILWTDAVADGSVRASGERADVSTYLPLL